jgi:hypothetical protein
MVSGKLRSSIERPNSYPTQQLSKARFKNSRKSVMALILENCCRKIIALPLQFFVNFYTAVVSPVRLFKRLTKPEPAGCVKQIQTGMDREIVRIKEIDSLFQ